MKKAHMDSLLGQTIACGCGRTHRIQPHQAIYAEDAMDRLAETCKRFAAGRRVAVITDCRTREVAGRQAAAVLAGAGWEVREALIEDLAPPLTPVCDRSTRRTLEPLVGQIDLVVSVGSGVINDLGKWLAFDAGVPFVTFATAASMNGYASANVAATIDGVKSLLPARPPYAVLACPSILKDAPYELTAAGLGDVLAKPVSSADWMMNHVLFEDFYCARSVALIAEIEPMYLDRPAELRHGEDAPMEGLFDALLLTGVAMTMAETSAPASGAEHLISHSLDMMSSLDGVRHDLHGRQVGVGTILAAELYKRVLEIESPQLSIAPERIDRAFWGKLAGAIAEQYAGKIARLAAARDRLASPGVWDELRSRLAPILRQPQTIQRCLDGAGAACRAEDICPSLDRPAARGRLGEALLHAHEIRSRFTVLDLAYIVGLLPHAAEDILDAWA